MAGVVNNIQYENVQSATLDIGSDGNVNGLVWIEFDPNAQAIVVNQGDAISLEMADIRLNGIYTVLAKKSSPRGYSSLKIKAADTNGGGKAWMKAIGKKETTGRIYFGKRNVITSEGGTATQVLNNDVFKVMLGLGLLIITSLAAYSFFGSSK